MIFVLRKIPLRKILGERGKSSCVAIAIFLTTVLFVIIFSALSFVQDALKELSRKDASWLADAAFIVTEDEALKIRKSPLVEASSMGYHVGEIEISDYSDSTDIELVYYEEEMIQWMKCYPAIGRIPQSHKEIVVSDWFLEKQGLSFSENMDITFTFWLDNIEYTDTFCLVGVYEWNAQSKHVMLVSNDYYLIMKDRLDQLGENSEEAMSRMMEVIFASSQEARELTFLLMEEIGFDMDKGGFLYNEASFSAAQMGTGGIFIFTCILLFVLLAGYLFISNIFQICLIQEVKFYGKLASLGVTAKEIKGIVYCGNNLLYLAAAIPAVIVGFFFSVKVLPGILNSFFTVQVQGRSNFAIFFQALFFSYLTLLISERKAVRLAGQISPRQMRHFMGNYPTVKRADNTSCLWKLVVRGFWRDRKKALKIILSISFSILLANTFYTIVKGFDAKEYVSRQLDADYTVAKGAFFNGISARDKETLIKEELGESLPSTGILAEGGGAVCYINLPMSKKAWALYDAIVGEDNLNNEEGSMLTYLYGLDEIMVDKLLVKKGELNAELYRSGDYALIDALNDNGETCFEPGDQITIPYSSGKEKKYIVMAVVELPYNLSYQSKWVASSNLFLPMDEWQKQTGQEEYYLYTYDVQREYQEIWDAAFRQLVNENKTLQYKSAKTLSDETKEYISQLKLVGLALSIILICMGLINFVNCMANSIFSRKKEFAILQSMGMSKAKLISVLSVQGLLYMAGGFFLGLFITIPSVYVFIKKIWDVSYLEYSFYPELYLLFGAIGIMMAILVPWISFLVMDRQEPFLKRIRMCGE